MTDDFKSLRELLGQLKKSDSKGVTAQTLLPETKRIMEMVETAIQNHGFKYIGDNGFGPGTRPPKIPGYDRIPDFAVDRNSDGYWDMIIEVKSSSDWDLSDEQLKDFYSFSRIHDLDFLVVVHTSIYSKAETRYKGIGLFDYTKFKLVPVG